MIVAMQEKATEDQIDAVIDAMVESGVNVHRTTGAYQTILAGVGPTANVELRKFELLPGVLYVHRITAPYKLAGRAFRPEGTQVEFANGVTIGGDRTHVMAGPCSIETREQVFETAKRVKAAGGSFLRGGAFKPRSSPYAFQGLGIQGLELMREAANEHGLLTVSEVMEIAQIEPMLPFVDCFQVGARNMQNFNLLRASQSCSSAESRRLSKSFCYRASTSSLAGTTRSFSASVASALTRLQPATPWTSRPFRC